MWGEVVGSRENERRKVNVTEEECGTGGLVVIRKRERENKSGRVGEVGRATF